MSTNSNFRKDKCWSCEFFCGHRQYKKGILFGDSVETDSQGSCTNNRSSNSGKTVRENDWCSKYQKWGVLQSAIAKQEEQQERARQTQQQRTQELIQQEQNAERLRQEREETDRIYSQISNERAQIEAERKCLEQERKALEHEQWYSSLSQEEREKYDAEQARLKAERTERERLENERSIEREKQAEIERAEQERLKAIEREEKRKQEEAARRTKNRNIIIASCVVAVLIVLAICLPITVNSIKKNNAEKAFNASNAGKVLNYIRSKSNGKDEYSFKTSVDDIQLEFTVQYLANGFNEATGVGSYSKGEGKYSFMAVTKVGNRNGYAYSACYGTAIFNWNNLSEMRNMFLVGEVWYEQNSVFNHYQRYTKGDHCPVINYEGVYHNYGSWDKSLDLEEAKKVGWDACEMTIIFLNQISNEVLGSNLW